MEKQHSRSQEDILVVGWFGDRRQVVVDFPKYCTGMTNPAVIGHHQVCRCLPETPVMGHRQSCRTPQGESSVAHIRSEPARRGRLIVIIVLGQICERPLLIRRK